MRADFRLNLPPIGSHPLRSYALFKPHYLTVPPVTEELLKALPVLVFAVFFSDDRKDILPAAMSVGIGFSILYVLFYVVRRTGRIRLPFLSY